MSETPAAEPRDAAKDVISMTSATLAADLVAAMLNELRTIPDHWTRIASDRQQQSIERLKERSRAIIDKGLKLLAGCNFPAVPATLDFVASRKGISAGLTIDKGALARHALFDAQGQRVLIVIADAAAWCEGLDKIKASDDQLKLFDPDANYDPARDQPGYRRDQDPFVPAGPTWADLKKGLMGRTEPPSDGTKPAEGETPPVDGETKPPEGETAPPPVEGESLPDDTSDGVEEDPELAASIDRADLEVKLRAAGVVVSVGEIQSWTALQFNVAQEWAEAYAEGMQTQADRPDFLPAPNKEGKK